MIPPTARRVMAAAGCAAALPGVIALWGFTVDDALISSRVATRLLGGMGHRFNSDGPPVDAITPLGYGYLLAALGWMNAQLDAWELWERARIAGALAWLVAAARIGCGTARYPVRVRGMVLVVLGTSVPLAAWAVTGMETSWVTLLATLAVTQPRAAPYFAGLAAAWRPELFPWAITGTILCQVPRTGRGWVALLLPLLLPGMLVVAARLVVFGHPLPLAVEAKPADFALGARYALGAVLLSGPPLLLCFGSAYRLLAPRERAWSAAFFVHMVAVTLAGGDWMSFFRLIVPTLPGVLLASAALLATVSPRAAMVRVVPALIASGALWVYKVPAARAVAEQRRALIDAGSGPLRGVKRVGCVDIGWVGAATSGDVFDFAGVTDPRVAVLPGGHTSKRIPSAMLVDRGVDALVLLLAEHEPVREPWYQSHFYYAVDRHVARHATDLGFVPSAVVPLGGSDKHYVVLRRE